MKNDSHSSFVEYFGMLNVCSRSQFPPLFSQRRDTPKPLLPYLIPKFKPSKLCAQRIRRRRCTEMSDNRTAGSRVLFLTYFTTSRRLKRLRVPEWGDPIVYSPLPVGYSWTRARYESTIIIGAGVCSRSSLSYSKSTELHWRGGEKKQKAITIQVQTCVATSIRENGIFQFLS